jgi:hypothetical protein
MQSQTKWALLIVALFGFALWAFTVAARLSWLAVCTIFDLARYGATKTFRRIQASREQREAGIRLSREWAKIKQAKDDTAWLSTCRTDEAFNRGKTRYRLIGPIGEHAATLIFERGLCVAEHVIDDTQSSAIAQWMDETTCKATKPSEPKPTNPRKRKRKYTKRKIKF